MSSTLSNKQICMCPHLSNFGLKPSNPPVEVELHGHTDTKRVQVIKVDGRFNYLYFWRLMFIFFKSRISRL